MKMINLDGINIHYEWIPHPDGESKPTLVLINSLGTDFRIWDKMISILHPHANLLRYDKRGHGLSDIVPGTKDLIEFAIDLVKLVDRLSIKSFIPVGVSVGGMISILLGKLLPGKVEKLVLCDTSFRIGTRESWLERVNTVQEKGIKSLSDSIMIKWFAEDFRKNFKEELAGYQNMLERSPLSGYQLTCLAIGEADLVDITKKISIPVLCVVGSEDGSTPPEQVRILSETIPGAQFKIIDGSGHLPCVDQPEKLGKIILDFLKQ